MPRGKSTLKILLDSSQSALYAGIEIHNKPHIDYRYPTTVILIINSWELLLKASVFKYIGKDYIYDDKKSKYTITFSKALVKVRDDINKKESIRSFDATFENLNLLNEYRCSNVHYIGAELNPIIFMLLSKSILDYDKFAKKHFNRDISKKDNLIIMPIGLKLPIDPIKYLTQKYDDSSNKFVKAIIDATKSLNNNKIQDSIFVGIDVCTMSVKKVNNADVIAAIDNSSDLKLTKSVRITNDPNAPSVRIDDSLPPLTYDDLKIIIKTDRPDIKFNSTFNKAVSLVKDDPSLCRFNYLNPKTKKGTKKCFYEEKAINKIIENYDMLNKITKQPHP